MITWVEGLDREEEKPDMEVTESKILPKNHYHKVSFRKRRYVTVFRQAWVCEV